MLLLLLLFSFVMLMMRGNENTQHHAFSIWCRLTPAQRDPYNAMYEEDRIRYDQEEKSWRAKLSDNTQPVD